MKRHEAAAAVNEALKNAGIEKALKDPKCKGLDVEIGDSTAKLVFRHAVTAMEQRKADVAGFRARLVDELVAKALVLKAPEKPVEPSAPATPVVPVVP
jgi:hypothetical protein